MFVFFFFFNDTATTEIYTLSLHDALPIYLRQTTRTSLARDCSRPSIHGSSGAQQHVQPKRQPSDYHYHPQTASARAKRRCFPHFQRRQSARVTNLLQRSCYWPEYLHD